MNRESRSIEEVRLLEFVSKAQGETKLEKYSKSDLLSSALIVVEGFEERSIGVLKSLALRQAKVSTLVIGRYNANTSLNARFRESLEEFAGQVALNGYKVVEVDDSLWVPRALAMCEEDRVIVDVSAVSHKEMFPLLDGLVAERRTTYLAYSEAESYWPTRAEWERLRGSLSGGERIAELVDEKPWLFGCEHTVGYVPNHEGYGGTARGVALLAFLPYKCARLAAILGEESYSELLFIGGQPRLRKNRWRFRALMEINEPLIGARSVTAMPTFGYKDCVTGLTNLLFRTDRPVQEYDVHLALLGSKLQTVGCWIVATYLPSIVALTSTPREYFPEAFSDGVGESWFFRLVDPNRYL
ncbi:MAG: hypothetical protein ABIS20_17670 [Thermoanaerobaculia bacterium]